MCETVLFEVLNEQKTKHACGWDDDLGQREREQREGWAFIT